MHWSAKALDHARKLERELADAERVYQAIERKEDAAVSSKLAPGLRADVVKRLRTLHLVACAADKKDSRHNETVAGLAADIIEADALAASATRETHWVFAAAEAHRHIVEGLNGCEIDRKHLLYMLDEIKRGHFTPTKACRWLGWIQGVLNEKEALTLDDAKAINKAASVASADGRAVVPQGIVGQTCVHPSHICTTPVECAKASKCAAVGGGGKA